MDDLTPGGQTGSVSHREPRVDHRWRGGGGLCSQIPSALSLASVRRLKPISDENKSWGSRSDGCLIDQSAREDKPVQMV